MWDDPARSIDARIDAAARRMTDRLPPADLRIRIVERIASAERPRSISFVWILAPAAIAMLVVAVLLGVRARHSRLPEPAPIIVRGETPPAPTPVVRTPDELQRRSTAIASAATRRPHLRRARAALPAPQAADRLLELHVAPLTVDAISLPPIDATEARPPEGIGLTRLAITPLAFEGER
jgi:hypothetical protein